MKPKLAVYKFASCDGCQLAFLNAGEDLLDLARLVDIVHFPEAGPVNPEAKVDIAFVEGSVSSPEQAARIQHIRDNTGTLITIGACATAGGLQALRNFAPEGEWQAAVYAKPEYIDSLTTATPVREHVKVDLELWGCPVDGPQVLRAVRQILFGVVPREETDKVCLECKRRERICVMVTRQLPCMGPVTRTGCGAICPGAGRDCYACFGPAENANVEALARRLEGFGLLPAAIAQRFLFINSQAPGFRDAGQRWKAKADDIP